MTDVLYLAWRYLAYHKVKTIVLVLAVAIIVFLPVGLDIIVSQSRVEPGGHILSSPESVFDLAGVYPLKMKVVGILKSTGTPDDFAVFVDVKTTWVIEGLAHGHQDLSRPEATAGVLRKEGNKVIGNAAVVQYNEITSDNVASFHFHGDPATFPITSVIVVPEDQKSSDLLRGRYLSDAEQVQIIAPANVMDDLLGTIFTVRGYVMAAVLIVGIATLATMVLVFILSLQLRRREMETMQRIGGSRSRIRGLVAVEILGVLGCGVLVAGVLAALTGWFATAVTRMLVALS